MSAMGSTTTKVRRARGERRRRELLEAALTVIDDRGVQGTTHRAVAEAAGVPLATTTYYFESIDHLLEEALELFVAEEVARVRALAEQLRGTSAPPIEIAQLFARELVEGSPWRTPLRRVQFELYVEAARRPGLRAAAQASVAAYVEAVEAALESTGAPRAAEGARHFVAMTDGLGIQRLFTPTDAESEREDVTAALLELFIPFAMGAEERAGWDRRLAEPRAGERAADEPGADAR